jgi:hypothetical protein
LTLKRVAIGGLIQSSQSPYLRKSVFHLWKSVDKKMPDLEMDKVMAGILLLPYLHPMQSPMRKCENVKIYQCTNPNTWTQIFPMRCPMCKSTSIPVYQCTNLNTLTP